MSDPRQSRTDGIPAIQGREDIIQGREDIKPSTPGTAPPLHPEAAPPWLQRLVDNVDHVPRAFRRRVPAQVLAMVTVASKKASMRAALTGASRDAAVLVLFSGPRSSGSSAASFSGPRSRPASDAVPDDADLLLTVRASTLRHHAGQAAFPGGATDPDDGGPVETAFREAREETGIDTARLHPLATLERMFIPPSGFHVVPVLAYSPDPGPVAVVDEAETAMVARVPVRAFINPKNRLMVYRKARGGRFAGPAFLLDHMLVWGFTGQIISAILDVAGWARPWNTDDVRELQDAMALVCDPAGDPAGDSAGDSAGDPAGNSAANPGQDATRQVTQPGMCPQDAADSYGEAQQ